MIAYISVPYHTIVYQGFPMSIYFISKESVPLFDVLLIRNYIFLYFILTCGLCPTEMQMILPCIEIGTNFVVILLCRILTRFIFN